MTFRCDAIARLRDSMLAAAQARDFPRMLELQRGFHDLLADLFQVLAGEVKIDGAYNKLWLRLGGFSEAQYQACRRLLEREYPDWLPG